ncbi:acyl-coa-binding domain-containing protein 4 [Nicotiana attenuata]|uniref:Acyl-coa-binding domain-containing protein 4 n=1 Tax=Nicotiana attenuata TaxID=49451 RepID=A0A1J6IWS2_NICAT|nr:acyl-coa-binding domain-containing protein 4 [Nicotiana attenuata]
MHKGSPFSSFPVSIFLYLQRSEVSSIALSRGYEKQTASAVGNNKIVMYGGWDGKKWLSDVYILDTSTVFDSNSRFSLSFPCVRKSTKALDGPTEASRSSSYSALWTYRYIWRTPYIWQWSELTSFGDLPSAKDFAAASAIGNSKIVMYGGWDGKKWLSYVYILDTMSLEWRELSVLGTLPPPRCGHTSTMVEKRLLVYGGRGKCG